MRLRGRAFALYAALPEAERTGVSWTEDEAQLALFKMGWEAEEKMAKLKNAKLGIGARLLRKVRRILARLLRAGRRE